MSQEIITRGHLPHWYVPGACHFITYRLVDTLPAEVLHDLRRRRDARLREPPSSDLTVAQFRERLHKQFFAAYDRYLDRNCAVSWLANPPVAALIRGNLHHHDGSKYSLLAYCIMPNHVHVLLQPIEIMVSRGPEEPDERADTQSPLATIMHSLKSYTANKANAVLQRSGQFWQHESYDHWVRDEDELERIVHYIAWNPVKAGLVSAPHEWYFGSAHERLLQDGSKCGYLLS